MTRYLRNSLWHSFAFSVKFFRATNADVGTLLLLILLRVAKHFIYLGTAKSFRRTGHVWAVRFQLDSFLTFPFKDFTSERVFWNRWTLTGPKILCLTWDSNPACSVRMSLLQHTCASPRTNMDTQINYDSFEEAASIFHLNIWHHIFHHKIGFKFKFLWPFSELTVPRQLWLF